MSDSRLRVGIVGCGSIAQVMHLHYLRELDDCFAVHGLCDLSPDALRFAAGRFPEARLHKRWDELLAQPLDAVLVLTTGSHAPIAIAAARAGIHVFVEKPMSRSVTEAHEMLAAAETAGVRLMVGYMKRYDPAYEQLLERLDTSDLRLVRVTTLESPEQPYVMHYPRAASTAQPNGAADVREDDERRITEAIGVTDPVVRRAYGGPLLDSMVHELNAVRGVLGEPSELRSASIWGGPAGITATMAFGPVECVFMWVELPGIARYEQELAFYGAQSRMRLTFPSPFLRSMPTTLVTDGGEPGTSRSWSTRETVSFEEAFKRELREFHDAIVDGREPRTPGSDGIRDIALVASIVRCHVEQRPVPFPTELAQPVRAR